MGDVAQDALALFTPVLRGLVVELVKALDSLLCLLQLALNLYPPLPGLRDLIVLLTCFLLCQPLKLVVVMVNIQRVSPDPDHDGLEERLERLVAEEEDMAMRLPDNRAGVKLVRDCVPRENEMPGRKDEDPLAVAAFGDVDTSGALSVRSGSGSDPQTKCGSERTADADGCVIEVDIMMFQELRTGRPGEDGLPELDVDVGDLKFIKKSSAADGRNPGVVARETGASPRSKEQRDREPLWSRRLGNGQHRYSSTGPQQNLGSREPLGPSYPRRMRSGGRRLA